MNAPRYPNLELEHAREDVDTLAEIITDVERARDAAGFVDGSIPLALAGDYEGEADDELAEVRSNLSTAMELLSEAVAALERTNTVVQTAKQEAEDRAEEEDDD